MYFQCIILMTISQIISGSVITGKRKATFSENDLIQICKTIRSDLAGGIAPEKAINQIVGQFEPKLKSEDGSRLTKFKELFKSFKRVIEIVENGPLKALSTTRQDESNESPQSADDIATNRPDSDGDLINVDDDQIVDDNQGVTVNPNADSDEISNEIDSLSPDENEIETEFETGDNDEYNVCELINYPDYIDLDEIEYSEIYGYDYGDYDDDDDDDSYEYDYQFEPFGLRLNLHLSISD